MKLTIEVIDVPPPGKRTRRGLGWSEVFIHLRDEDLQVLPSVTVKVPVPYAPDDSFRAARQAALDRARSIIAAAADSLAHATLEELDRVRPDRSA